MKKIIFCVAVLVGTSGFALDTRGEEPFAKVKFDAKSGAKVTGTATLLKKTDRLVVQLDLQNIEPGEHAIHVHEKGSCAGKDAAGAGEHFNPDGLKHAGPDSADRHAGDFGNIDIPKEGRANLKIEIPMPPKQSESVNWDVFLGKSLVIHKGKDDFSTQPSGNSGDKIACGIIRRVSQVSE